MAHIHLEDGAFTLKWSAVWCVLAIVLISLCLHWLRKGKETDSKTIKIRRDANRSLIRNLSSEHASIRCSSHDSHATYASLVDRQ